MLSFTSEDLVQFMYNEASPAKKEAIKTALENDWALRERYEVVTSAQKRLKTLDLFSPRKKAIDKILVYAEKSIKELTPEP